MEQSSLLYAQFWDNDPSDRNSYESLELFVGNSTYAYKLVNVSLAFIYYRSLRLNLKWELYSWDLDLSIDEISNLHFIESEKNIRNGTFMLESLNLTFIEYRINV